MKLSVVIPAHNEEGSIEPTVTALTGTLREAGVDYEVVVIDDNSTDSTAQRVSALSEADEHVRYVKNDGENGFGMAVRKGLESFRGDAVTIVMADGSDDPVDVVSYARLLEAGYDCAFGSRFMVRGSISGYPRLKLVINRLVNWFIRALFGHGYDDTTNAFKAYRREVIESVQPLLSQHFNLTVELPLKAIIRGHSYAITPIRWYGRTEGTSKLKLEEMGSRYLFIVLYAFLEHHLSRGDYRRPGSQRDSRWRAGRPAARIYKEPSAR